jgi:hypothetical protein
MSQVQATYQGVQTAGNANILAIGWNDTTANITGVGDSAGNIYHAAVATFRGNGLSQAIYYATNIVAGSNAVTVTFTQPAAYVDLRVTEYSGLSPTNVFDSGASVSGVSVTADSGGVTIAATNELLFGAGMTATTFSGAGLGFTQRVITVPDADIIEDRVAPGPGIYNATAGLSSGAWLMQLAAFRPAVFGPPTLRILLTATNTVIVAWPTVPVGYSLQRSSALDLSDWQAVTNAVSVISNEKRVTVPITAAPRFFRLKY